MLNRFNIAICVLRNHPENTGCFAGRWFNIALWRFNIPPSSHNVLPSWHNIPGWRTKNCGKIPYFGAAVSGTIPTSLTKTGGFSGIFCKVCAEIAEEFGFDFSRFFGGI
jgi:hypothetical protein